MIRRFATALLILPVLLGACSRRDAPRRYPFAGQILAVHHDRGEITIRHHDIEGLMPAMTMSFGVAEPSLLDGWSPGDLVAGTLEVTESLGHITALTKAGHEPLPDDATSAALAAGLLRVGDPLLRVGDPLLRVGDPLPDAALIDHRDQRRSLSEWSGTPTLVTFIYTRCPLPNFCPLMDQNFAAIQRAVAEDPELAGRVQLVSISFDPEHDTPEVLAGHAARLRADPAVWTFLTGDRVTVDRVAARFGVGVVRETDATGAITHSLRTTLVGADGRVAAIYTGNDWTPGRVLADVRAALRRP